MVEFDIIIVGAGTAGSVAAWSAAKKGANVLILEAKTQDKIGKKICGDEVGVQHFDGSSLPKPPKEIVLGNVKSVVVYSPSGKHGFTVEGEGYALNRKEWGLWLVRLAMDAGAQLKHSTRVVQPIFDKDRVVGVKTVNSENGEQNTFRGKIIIDASGWTGAIRRCLPEKEGIDIMPLQGDLCVCYREVRALRHPIVHPETARIYVDQNIAPGGYWWFFPQGTGQVNIGLGVQGGRQLDPKHLYFEHLSKLGVLSGSELLDGGGGVVPTRRSMHTLVGFGVIFIGDAAFTVNPISGGGIGPSMRSGLLAGSIANEALSETDKMDRVMWRLNGEYVRSYGIKATGLDIFRIFLQNVKNEDIEFGMEKQLITQSDLHQIGCGYIDLPISEKTLRLVRGISRPTVLRHLATTSSYMKKVKQKYQEYPSIEEFQRWSEQINAMFNEFQEKITR